RNLLRPLPACRKTRSPYLRVLTDNSFIVLQSFRSAIRAHRRGEVLVPTHVQAFLWVLRCPTCNFWPCTIADPEGTTLFHAVMLLPLTKCKTRRMTPTTSRMWNRP